MLHPLSRCFIASGIVAALLWNVDSLHAEVRLPEVFASKMVLQRDLPVPVWGWADPGEEVSVTLGEQTQKGKADAGGKWTVCFKPLKVGAPLVMTVKGKNTLTLDDILVGDVWLCSGQSNMEWRMRNFEDSKADIPNAANPAIRLFHVEKSWNRVAQQSLNASWKECTPETIPDFSAVGYYFGKKLNAELKVPIGLINSSWGGTRIEPWTTPEGFKAIKSLAALSEEIEARDPTSALHKKLVGETLEAYKAWIAATEKNLAAMQPVDPPPAFPALLTPYQDHQKPTVLHNAMVNPFVPLALRGVIWYQGESNRMEGMLYAEKMKALIAGLRIAFNNPEMPFYFVQLAPYDYKSNPEALAKIWEAQASVEKNVKNTGMAVINDIGNLKNIHPDKKNVVGARLADLALNRTYGKKEIACDFPESKGVVFDRTGALIDFANAKSLSTRDGKTPNWFEIAGTDGKFKPATATIRGTSVRVEEPTVQNPCAVRFAWSMLAEPNLQNELGLPVGAFRAGEIPERGDLDKLIAEAKNYKLIYSFNPLSPVLLDNKMRLDYTVDKTDDIFGQVKRVAYFLHLKPRAGQEQYVFVTMPPLSKNLKQLGVPTKGSGARFQQEVSDVTVLSNVPGVETGRFATGCNVEFWDCNYAAANEKNIPGASSEKFDFGDVMNTNSSPGYGSMQVHNYAKKQTIFAFNAFDKGPKTEVGIGNSSGRNPDWTFTGSAGQYETGLFLILVETE